VILWRWTKAAVKWWVVTFVIGDDWRVAARIAVALLATWGLVEAGVGGLVASAHGGALRDRAQPASGRCERTMMHVVTRAPAPFVDRLPARDATLAPAATTERPGRCC